MLPGRPAGSRLRSRMISSLSGCGRSATSAPGGVAVVVRTRDITS